MPGAPSNVADIGATSGNVANASASAQIGPSPDKRTYCTGFQVTGAGATSALTVTVLLLGPAGGALAFSFTFPAGATVAAVPLIVTFPTPLVTSTVNQSMILSVPASGAGGTNLVASIQGFFA